MFSTDDLIEDCRLALAENEPRRAVREVLERAVRHPHRLREALPEMGAGIVPLHASEDLSVLHVVWAPGMRFRPHDHLMWAVIGIYGGQEDNAFYRRRQGGGVVLSGGRELHEGDVAMLGDDTIHAVSNLRRTPAGAIHVYGGDITTRPGRTEWDEETQEEIAYDFERTRRIFEAANAARA